MLKKYWKTLVWFAAITIIMHGSSTMGWWFAMLFSAVVIALWFFEGKRNAAEREAYRKQAATTDGLLEHFRQVNAPVQNIELALEQHRRVQ
jgi:hypothetical protein